MLVLKGNKLRKEIKENTLFSDIHIEIYEGEHIALIGKNGIGKTTLLKALLDLTELDGGTIQKQLPIDYWGYIEQNPESSLTLLEYVQESDRELSNLKKAIDGKNDNIFNQDYYQRYLELGGFNWELKIERILISMGLDVGIWNLPFESLSGGQKTRAQIARVMIKEPKFLVLDEPTNHLDKETLEWLEKWLSEYQGAFLLVTHDRYFTDKVAHYTYEMSDKGLKRYKGGYSKYKECKELELKTQWELYKKQEKEKKEIQEAIKRYTQWFGSALIKADKTQDPHEAFAMKQTAQKHVNRFKAKEKQLERLESIRVDKPRQDSQLKMQLTQGQIEAKKVVKLDKVSFSYPQKEVFNDLTLLINSGDKVGLIGPNGSGKTTLLKLITGELLSQEGSVVLNPQVKIGYFAQELEELEYDKTLLDSLLEVPGMTQTQARTILGCFLFSNEAVFKKIGSLSMGERCRVAFLKLYFSGANLLVLDEPTNYLDIETREKIEETLKDFPGAIICVSHDRYLLSKIATRVIDIGKGVINFPGNYKEYEESLTQKQDVVDLNQDNLIKQLELQLANLMAVENPEDELALLKKIKEVKERMENIKRVLPLHNE